MGNKPSNIKVYSSNEYENNNDNNNSKDNQSPNNNNNNQSPNDNNNTDVVIFSGINKFEEVFTFILTNLTECIHKLMDSDFKMNIFTKDFITSYDNNTTFVNRKYDLIKAYLNSEAENFINIISLEFNYYKNDKTNSHSTEFNFHLAKLLKILDDNSDINCFEKFNNKRY